jgi:3'-phosphoadenosine 5'-phosphosulfate sulfotransferase (PAPS reductase)/FAD synthetase
MEAWELKQMQSLPLEIKIIKTQLRIKEWYEHWDGQVYVSFSGGKDSTVLLKLVRELYPDVPAVFADTGLEYPEIRDFVRTFNNVVWLKPKMTFNKVIEMYGYPVFSKDVSGTIRYARAGSKWAFNNLNGLNADGSESPYRKGMYGKYKKYIEAPFKISNQCCLIMKEKPLQAYEKEMRRKPFIGLMANESKRRENGYLMHGCNAFDIKRPTSKPLGFWMGQDVLQYLKQFNIPYATVYGDIIRTSRGLVTTGAERTGCMFCMFGVHLDKGENRFQRMSRTHPKQYDYCINKLGLGEVLDYIGVDYRVNNLFS